MYCAVPFDRLHVDVHGEANLCYGQTWTSRGIGNVLATDVMELWRSPQATAFRQAILDQSFELCTDCRCPEMVERRDPPAHHDLDTIGCLVLSYDYRCNLSCPSCRTTLHKPSPLSEQIHDTLMRSGVLSYVRMVSAMGSGEALASPLFWDLVDVRLRSPDCYPTISLSLTTNGVLLTPRRLERILAPGRKLVGVEVSVDAARPETYAVNRRGGSWTGLMENLRHLSQSQIPLRLNFVVQANNYREMPAFVELALGLGADYVRFDALNNWGSFTPSEYEARAVHRPQHPEHQQLREVLAHPLMKDPRVHLAQLSEDFLETGSPLVTLRRVGARGVRPVGMPRGQ
jgi:hypothetical protein